MIRETPYLLTITVPVEITPVEGVTPAKIASVLQWILTNWSDGRYPFSSELITHGLTLALRRAVEEAVSEVEGQKFGGETVPYFDANGIENGATAKWLITTEKIMQKVQTGLGDMDRTEVTIQNDTRNRNRNQPQIEDGRT